MWTIEVSSGAKKQIKKLPERIKAILKVFLREVQSDGPIRKTWPNFSALSKRKNKIPPGSYHCHLKKGRPTYVVCWRIVDKKIKIVEVFYVGSHEDVPY